MTVTLSSGRFCGDCGALLESGEQTAYCPACLWRDLTEAEFSQDASGSDDAQFAVAGHDVLEEIARGGVGIVYRARQRDPRREVALKMLLPHQTTSEEMHARFRIEADAIAALEHPAILPVYLVGEHRGMPFFTMKLAIGGTLASRRDTMSGAWRAIAELVATLADAVHFAHARGVIHRDLKPANILFDETDHPYVSDFGLAKFLTLDVRVTRTHAAFGTPAYLAPEVAKHGASAATTATDVYGLGAILYELLAGRPPFHAESLPALMRQIAEEPPKRISRERSSVPRDLEVIALRCLEKNPSHRLPSAAELSADLRRWLNGHPVHARSVGKAEKAWRWARRNPELALLSSLLAVSLVAGGAVLIDRNINLERSNTRALAAEREARAQLQSSLISAARMTQRTGQVGQRSAALALLDQAAELGSGVQLRTEYIAALVRNDLTIDRRMSSAHARSDYTVDFSPDLSHFLVADGNEGFVERDAVTDEVTMRFRSSDRGGEVWYLGYAAGGSVVTASYRDGLTEIWDRRSATRVWSGGGLYGGDAQPHPIAVHPTDGSVARVAASDAVMAIDLANGRERLAIAAQGEVRVLSFSPDGQVLLIVHRDRASAWSWVEGKLLWSFAGRMSPARPAWSADGRRLAVGLSGHDDIAVIDSRTGRVERLFAAHGDDVRLLAFQSGGRLLASVGWDGRLALHDFLTGELSLQREAWVRTLRFSRDGRRLAFSFNHVDVATATLAQIECLRELGDEPISEGSSCRLAVSPDGRWIASVDFTEIRLWDTHTQRLVWKEAAANKAWSMVAFTGSGSEVVQSRRFSDLTRRRLIVRRDGGDDVAMLGAAEACASGKEGDLVRIDERTGDWWMVRFSTGELVRWPGGRPADEVVALQASGLDGPGISPGARFISRKLYPKEGVQILDTQTGAQIAPLPVGQTLSALFTADGKWLWTATDREYRLWKTGTWEPGPSWPADIRGASYGGVNFSPKGDHVAVLQGRGTVELRDTKKFEVLLRLELPHDWWVNHFAWAPGGNRIYVLGLGHRVMFWDIDAVRGELAARSLDWE